ncbi:MAG TPA: phage tail protein [Alphaproteobacteria bacterium]|nr:phage tail protein [Alphaproteobacteria bacterium]
MDDRRDLTTAGQKMQLDLGSDRLKRDLTELRVRTREFREDLREVSRAGRETGQTLSRAFGDAILRGKNLSDVFKGLALRLGEQALNRALDPVGDALGTALSSGLEGVFARGFSAIRANAKGNAFANGKIVPLARGGVVDGPTFFPMRSGETGLMGEAGPEAIMPLARGADGRLGVRTQGGSGGNAPVTINFNVTTPDAASFRRSESQIAAVLNRMAERGARNR